MGLVTPEDQILPPHPQALRLHHPGAQPGEEYRPGTVGRRPEKEGRSDGGNVMGPDPADGDVLFRIQQQRAGAQEKHRHSAPQYAAPEQGPHPVGAPGLPGKAPMAEAWIKMVPKIAAVLAASTGALRFPTAGAVGTIICVPFSPGGFLRNRFAPEKHRFRHSVHAFAPKCNRRKRKSASGMAPEADWENALRTGGDCAPRRRSGRTGWGGRHRRPRWRTASSSART